MSFIGLVRMASLAATMALAACGDDNPLIGQWELDRRSSLSDVGKSAASLLGHRVEFTDKAMISLTDGRSVDAKPVTYTKGGDRWIVLFQTGQSISLKVEKERLLMEVLIAGDKGEIPYCKASDPKKTEAKPSDSEIKEALEEMRKSKISAFIALSQKRIDEAKARGEEDRMAQDAIAEVLSSEFSYQIQNTAKTDNGAYLVKYGGEVKSKTKAMVVRDFEAKVEHVCRRWAVLEQVKSGTVTPKSPG